MFGSLSYKQHQSVFKFYSIGFAATGVIPLRMVGYFLSIRNSKLIIDNTGIHQTLGRKQTNYLWRDISGTALIEKRGGGGRGPKWVSKQLQIRTITRDVDDDRANLISGIFGIRAIDLETIIQAGLSRWGGAHLANGPVFGRQFQAAKTD